MSSESSFHNQLAQSGLTESVLVPLVNQFGLMQQQMFDQFQQAMAMMVQMFGTMHRDQMEVIRAELDRLHELTDEFHALKDELANRTREQALTVWSEPSGHDRARAAATMSGDSSQRPAARTHEPANGLGAARVEPASAVPSQPSASGVQGNQPVQEPQLLPTPTTSSSNPLGVPHSSERPQEPGLRSQPKSVDARPAGGSDRDTIVWLHQRIIALQNERESRWQKILKLLPGVS
jgi:hypothetical protein